MKKIIITLLLIVFSSTSFAAGSDSSGSSGSGSDAGKISLYDEAVSLVKRAGRFEKKEKKDKAKKLYSKALRKLEKAYSNDKNNPDILNYLGYTSRKIGNFEEA